MHLVGSALLAEAEALRDGVRLIPTGTRELIIVETDSQVLASLWRDRDKHRSEVGVIMDEGAALASAFTSFRVVFSKRVVNFAAHLCAKQALDCKQNFVWLSAPTFLQQCLQLDCNVST
jgi:hypothetical protein